MPFVPPVAPNLDALPPLCRSLVMEPTFPVIEVSCAAGGLERSPFLLSPPPKKLRFPGSSAGFLVQAQKWVFLAFPDDV